MKPMLGGGSGQKIASVHEVGPGMVRAGDPTDVPSVRNLRDRAVRAASRDEIGDGSRGPAHTIADDEAVGSLAVDDDAGGCTDDLVPVDERLCRAGEQ